MTAMPRPTVLPTMELAAPVWTAGTEEVADAAPLVLEAVRVFWPVTVAVMLPYAGPDTAGPDAAGGATAAEL